ncbi:hypothetical protein [Amycolatopsis sp. cmx-4-68]|uniref:hypothetical protein n=1 Tax=Amycolatopsis sp. cmx-4-68 TaxID=2790938 RepID=UPI00397E14E7
MSYELRERAPRVRCHHCGSAEVKAICHHCDRPLCTKHAFKALVTSEFDGLGLRNATPHHCAEHHHLLGRPIRKPAYAAGGVALLGLLLALFLLAVPGLVLFVFGAIAAAGLWYEDGRRTKTAIRERPALPVVPGIDSVEVRETLRGELVLEADGTYRTSVTPVAGHIRLETTFGRPDQDRLREYRKRFRLSFVDEIRFSAGYLVLHGPAGLEFTDRERTDLVVPLTGEVSTQPFLSEDGRANAKWRVRLEHRLLGVGSEAEIPLWLTPALMPESDQRSLQLDLQWLGNWPSEESSLDADRVERLTLHVPGSWGNVEYAGDATVGNRVNPRTGRRLIEWKQLTLPQSDRRLRLAVHFEERIQLTDTITGSLVVSFRGAMSGLEEIHLYHPLGARRRGGTYRDVKTEVTAEVELSLNQLRYQDVRVVPDPRKDDPAQMPETHDFPGVIPDHETLIALTDAMSGDDYYVKRVIENPPRDRGRDGLVNRAWDIAGRRYDGVYPVDFHLVLTGEEAYGSDIRAEAGNTKVRLYVKGAYASEEMEARIKAAWYGLQNIMSETLRQRGRRSPQAIRGEKNGVPATELGTIGPQDARVKELKKRRENFEDALADRRISSHEFEGIVARIDRELAELDEGFGGMPDWEV